MPVVWQNALANTPTQTTPAAPAAAPSGAGANVQGVALQHRLEAFFVSRDAGAELTEHALQAGVTVQALATVAATAAEFADQALDLLQRTHRPALDCREGCSYCCCKPGVLVTAPEVVRILSYVHTTFDDVEIDALRRRAAAYAAQMDGRDFNAPVAEVVPCPLLVDGRCSAYEVRPLVCRGFNSRSVDACREAHGRPEGLIPTFALLRDVTDGTSIGIVQELQRAGVQDCLVDLGGALQIALAFGDGIAESLTGGEPLFAPVDATSWADDLWRQVREVARAADPGA